MFTFFVYFISFAHTHYIIVTIGYGSFKSFLRRSLALYCLAVGF